MSDRLMGVTPVGDLKINVGARNSADLENLLKEMQRIVAESVARSDQSLMMYDLSFFNIHFGVVDGEFAYNYVPPHFTEKKWIGIVFIPPNLTRKLEALFLNDGQKLLRDVCRQYRSVVLIFAQSRVRPHVLICSRSLREVAAAKERILKELDAI